MAKDISIATEDLLRKIGLIDVVSSDFIENLQTKSQVLDLNKGQIIFLHSDDADRFFIVQRGWIKLFKETLDGAQAVIDILTVGHIFGETSIFQDYTYPYSAEAAEPAQVLSIPLSILKNEIECNSKLALAMLSSMARYRKQQDQELEHRTLQNAPQRIGCFLLRLTDETDKGPVTIHLPYDKALVASRLGMQPETFSRALSKLKSQTGIRINGATVELDNINQLMDFSCSACSSEFPCKDIRVAAE